MRMVVTVTIVAMLAACSGGDEPASASAATGTVSEGNVFKADVDAMAKAKQAEQVIQDAAQQQRKEIDANQ